MQRTSIPPVCTSIILSTVVCTFFLVILSLVYFVCHKTFFIIFKFLLHLKYIQNYCYMYLIMQSNGSIPLVDESVRTYFCPENHYNDMATLFFNSQEEAIKQLFHQEGNIISTIPCHSYIYIYINYHTTNSYMDIHYMNDSQSYTCT